MSMVVDAPVRSSIQRRNTSEGLHFTEERFRNAFSSAVVAMALQDHNGKFLETNGAWCRMMGYCREECVGKELREFIHPEDLAAAEQDFQRFVQGTTPSLFVDHRF